MKLFIHTTTTLAVALVQALIWFPLQTVQAARSLNGSHTETFKSSSCPQNAVFWYRTELFYYYRVELNKSSLLDLEALEKAIAKGLVSNIGICSGSTFTGLGHRLSINGNCSKAGTTNCYMVRGLTSLLTAMDPMSMPEVAFEVIELLLYNETVLSQYSSSPILRARMVERFGNYTVAMSNPSELEGPETGFRPFVGIVVLAVCLFISVAMLFFYGIHRRQSASMDSPNKTKIRLSYYFAMRRRFWDQMEEGNQSPGLMMTAETPDRLQSSPWSVSDLSSEERSIKSALRMDRIEEESEAEAEEAEPETKVISENTEGSSDDGKYAAQISFIKHWHEEGNGRRWTNADTSVWEHAGMPPSYFDDSDPDAGTPVQDVLDDSGSADDPKPGSYLLGALHYSDDDTRSPSKLVGALDDDSCLSEAPSDETSRAKSPKVSFSSHPLQIKHRTDYGLPNQGSNHTSAREIKGESCLVGYIPSHIQYLAHAGTMSDESFDASASNQMSSSSGSLSAEQSQSSNSYGEELSGWTSPSYVALTSSPEAADMQYQKDGLLAHLQESSDGNSSEGPSARSPTINDGREPHLPDVSALTSNESDVESASGSVETVPMLLMQLRKEQAHDAEVPSSSAQGSGGKESIDSPPCDSDEEGVADSGHSDVSSSVGNDAVDAEKENKSPGEAAHVKGADSTFPQPQKAGLKVLGESSCSANVDNTIASM